LATEEKAVKKEYHILKKSGGFGAAKRVLACDIIANQKVTEYLKAIQSFE